MLVSRESGYPRTCSAKLRFLKSISENCTLMNLIYSTKMCLWKDDKLPTVTFFYHCPPSCKLKLPKHKEVDILKDFNRQSNNASTVTLFWNYQKYQQMFTVHFNTFNLSAATCLTAMTTYLQFGGGSNVISASSRWILKAKLVVLQTTLTQKYDNYFLENTF